jgi:hypothetical protein
MIGSVGGLPAHPLLVHIPVVVVPLAALGAVVMAIRSRWLPTYGPLVAALSFVGFVGALLAANTGEDLQDQFRASGQTISATLSDHAEMGDGVQLFAGLLFVLVLAWVLVDRWRRHAGDERAAAVLRRPRAVLAALAVVACLAGVAATASVVAAGHSGATVVWEKTAP